MLMLMLLGSEFEVGKSMRQRIGTGRVAREANGANTMDSP